MAFKTESQGTEQEKTLKIKALSDLFQTTPRGDKVSGNFSQYLFATREYSATVVQAACETLLCSWENTFESPQPGHVAAACRRFRASSNSEIRYQLERDRMAKAKRETMTPEIVRAELARVYELPLPEDDFDRRVEVRRRESLERILARWEGEEPVVPTRSRGEGGLSPIGDFVEVI